MAKKLACIVTGRVLTVANSYYEKKVVKAESEEKLKDTYRFKRSGTDIGTKIFI